MKSKWLMYARLNTVIYSVAGVLMLLVIWLTGEFQDNLYGNIIEFILFFGIASLNVFASLAITYRMKRQQTEGQISKIIILISFVGVLVGKIYYACPTNGYSKRCIHNKEVMK